MKYKTTHETHKNCYQEIHKKGEDSERFAAETEREMYGEQHTQERDKYVMNAIH